MPSIESKDESGNSNAKDAASNNDLTVRGRTFDQSKPETFNQVYYVIAHIRFQCKNKQTVFMFVS